MSEVSLPPILHYDKVSSTQDEVFALAIAGACSGTAVWANEQSAGRGQRGRWWYSGRGGLWMSVLLKVENQAELPRRIAVVDFELTAERPRRFSVAFLHPTPTNDDTERLFAASGRRDVEPYRRWTAWCTSFPILMIRYCSNGPRTLAERDRTLRVL